MCPHWVVEALTLEGNYNCLFVFLFVVHVVEALTLEGNYNTFGSATVSRFGFYVLVHMFPDSMVRWGIWAGHGARLCRVAVVCGNIQIRRPQSVPVWLKCFNNVDGLKLLV